VITLVAGIAAGAGILATLVWCAVFDALARLRWPLDQ
jgi:hypothetical protein